MHPLIAQAAEAATAPSAFDWTAAIGAITLGITTLGSIFAAIVGLYMRKLDLQQKELDAKIERDKIELNIKLETARLEARRHVRRADRKAKALVVKTDMQTQILEGTQQSIEAVKKQTNGMQEQLLKEVALRERNEGRQEGRIEGGAIRGVVKEVVKEVVPQPVVVTNQKPIDVNQVEGK